MTGVQTCALPILMRLNEEMWAVRKEFLDWLAGSLNTDKDGRRGIGALTGRAKLTGYPGDYQKGEPALATGELLEILRKNKARLSINLNDATIVDEIRKEYEGSLRRVLPLKERLQKTDALIDALVYRLYGLTEEEVRVVEGG